MSNLRILSHLPTGEAIADGFIELRANMLLALGTRSHPIVAVTSAHPVEPRQHVAAHLAAAAAQTGRRVILVDADVDHAVPTEPAPCTVSASLSVIPVPAVVAGDPALLSDPESISGLRSKANATDLMIVAAPPILDVPDTRALATCADGTLLVVIHGRTNREDAIRAAAILRHEDINLLGAVVVED